MIALTIERMNLPHPDFVLNEIIDPEEFDLNNATITEKINEVVVLLNTLTDSVVDGGSGADNISLTTVTPFISTKLQSFLEEVITRLRSTTANSSGADFIASTSITGVTGNTVQAQLKSLKGIFDTLQSQANSIQNQVTTNATNISNRYTKSEVDTKVTNLQNQVTTNASSISGVRNDLTNHTHDSRYMTRSELAPYLQGGDTVIKVEVFTITASNNGNGTFNYTNTEGVARTGALGSSGEQIFELEKGEYLPNMNHIKAYVNDALLRSKMSGGLVETSNRSVGLVSPEGAGAEVTVEYFQRVGVTGEHSINYGLNQPPPTDGQIMWFKVVG